MKFSFLALSFTLLATTASAHENGTIKIYDAQFLSEHVAYFVPGQLVLRNGHQKSIFLPKTARILNKNLEIVRDFYAENFGRKSWDNKGSSIRAALNVGRYAIQDSLGFKQNAAWTDRHILMFGAGDPNGYDGMETSLDTVAHEYTHAVIDTTSNLSSEGQSGALGEHFGDVFGSIINQINNPGLANPYLHGEGVLFGKKAIRDMMDPSQSDVPQPVHMKQLKGTIFGPYSYCSPSEENDFCGVHYLNGIPNKMAALVMSKIGPQKSAKLFYNVMTKGLQYNSDFEDYRIALMKECKLMASDTCSIVDAALNVVGL